MRSARHRSLAASAAAIAVLVATWSLLAAPPAGAIGPAPAQRTYFIVVMGLNEDNPFTVDAGCLTFTLTEMCPDEEACGTWRWVAQRNGFTYRLDVEEDGVELEISGRGRIDRMGPSNSIAGVGHALLPTFGAANFGFTGRPMPAAECQALAESFNQLVESAG